MLFKSLRYGAVLAALVVAPLVAAGPAQATQGWQSWTQSGYWWGKYAAQPDKLYIWTDRGWMLNSEYITLRLQQAQQMQQAQQRQTGSFIISGQNPIAPLPGGTTGTTFIIGGDGTDAANAAGWRSGVNAATGLANSMAAGARGTGGWEQSFCINPNDQRGPRIRCDQLRR